MKILLADDMKSFLDLERSFLSRGECELYTAGTGLEALKLATRLHPDLILLDVEMPEMTGIEACRLLKSNPQTASIPVVMISASGRREESVKAGANDYAQKPIDEVTFLCLVKKHAGLKERHDLRVPFGSPVTLRGPAGDFPCSARDLSSSGMALIIEARPPLGEQFTARLALPLREGPQTVQVSCVIVRHLQDGIAVRFFDMTSGAAMAIQEFISR